MDFCCVPVLGGVMTEVEATDTASAFAALADPTRLRMLSIMASSPAGSACGCDLETPLGLSQPTVSHHLKVLREAGLVTGEKKGRWIHYSVVTERLSQIGHVLTSDEL